MIWRPISSAPRDGTEFLAYWPSPAGFDDAWNICRTWWDADYDRWTTPDAECDEGDAEAPTHWLPCPPQPEAAR
jgi:hypothetical protein